MVSNFLQVYTLPEYLERRFGGNILRIYTSCLSLLLYVVTKIAVGGSFNVPYHTDIYRQSMIVHFQLL